MQQERIYYWFQKFHVKFNECKNLRKKHLLNLNDFLFSEKIDGERNFMFIGPDCEGYLINKKKYIQKICLSFPKNFIGLIFDCEVIKNKIYIFDIVNSTKGILNRQKDIENFLKHGTDVILIKKYYNTIDEIIPSGETTDGYILTSKNNLFDYNSALNLKWKSELTIDFKIQKKEDFFSLMSYDKKGDLFYTNIKISSLPEEIKTGDIVELKYPSLSFVRIRPDKYRGNYINVIQDIEETYKENVQIEELKKCYYTKYINPQDKVLFIDTIVTNSIKGEIYNYTTDVIKSIIELSNKIKNNNTNENIIIINMDDFLTFYKGFDVIISKNHDQELLNFCKMPTSKIFKI